MREEFNDDGFKATAGNSKQSKTLTSSDAQPNATGLSVNEQKKAKKQFASDKSKKIQAIRNQGGSVLTSHRFQEAQARIAVVREEPYSAKRVKQDSGNSFLI